MPCSTHFQGKILANVLATIAAHWLHLAAGSVNESKPNATAICPMPCGMITINELKQIAGA